MAGSSYMALPTTSPHADSFVAGRRSSEFSTVPRRSSDLSALEKHHPITSFSRRRTPSTRIIVLVCLLVVSCIAAASRFNLLSRATPMANDRSDSQGRCPTCTVDTQDLRLPLRHDLLHPFSHQKTSDEIGLTPSLNRTLGFERIYVINMPQRRDKKAEMTLLAYHYDLDLIFVDGVNGRTERTDVTNSDKQGQWGAAEAHAGAWRRMLADGASTALFMEDDADFSVFFKDQLLRIQEPLAMLSSMIDGKPTHRSPSDPWNAQHWDQLWLGIETEHWWSDESLVGNVTGLPYAVYRDPTRGQLHPGVYHDGEYADVMEAYKLPLHSDPADAHKRLRVVQSSVESFALSGYALSASGARKALYKNAHKSWIDHIDFDMKELGTHGYSRQYTVVPPIFNQRKPLEGEDSDRTGEAASSHVIAGTLGRTSTINNTAREHLFDNLVNDRHPAFVPLL